MTVAIVEENIGHHIYLIRSHKVMLDEDLAKIYGVSTKRLNQQVSRNIARFPSDFRFQLTPEETDIQRLQNATFKSEGKKRYRKYLPYVFTEHGAVMVSAVLNTQSAVQASIYIARTFVKLREILSSNRELAKKLDELDKKIGTHDHQIRKIVDAIYELTNIPEKPVPKIGFKNWAEKISNVSALKIRGGNVK